MRAIRSRRPATMPHCGPPSSLSPEKVTRSAPAAIVSRTVGSCGRPYAARSINAPAPRSTRNGTSARVRDRGDVGLSRRGDEALDAIVARVRLHHRGRPRPDRVRVVVPMGAVGRPHLHQPAARASHDVRDPERAADLDQLAARDQDFLLRLARAAERVEREQHGGRVVVDDGRGLGAGQFADQRLDEMVALAALAGREVVFEGERMAHRVDGRGDRRFARRRAPEVGVQRRAREIEHAAHLRHATRREPRRDTRGEHGRVERAGVAGPARVVDRRAERGRGARGPVLAG